MYIRSRAPTASRWPTAAVDILLYPSLCIIILLFIAVLHITAHVRSRLMLLSIIIALTRRAARYDH